MDSADSHIKLRILLPDGHQKPRFVWQGPAALSVVSSRTGCGLPVMVALVGGYFYLNGQGRGALARVADGSGDHRSVAFCLCPASLSTRG